MPLLFYPLIITLYSFSLLGDGEVITAPTYLIEEHQRLWPESDICIIIGQIAQESSWKTSAYRQEPSGVISYGLMQVTNRTFYELKKKYPTLLDYEPVQMLQGRYAVRAGILYDLMMWKSVPCNEPERRHYYMMLRAYNGGLGWIKREVKMAQSCEESEIEKHCLRSKTACKTNIDYPYKVFHYSNILCGGLYVKRAS